MNQEQLKNYIDYNLDNLKKTTKGDKIFSIFYTLIFALVAVFVTKKYLVLIPGIIVMISTCVLSTFEKSDKAKIFIVSGGLNLTFGLHSFFTVNAMLLTNGFSYKELVILDSLFTVILVLKSLIMFKLLNKKVNSGFYDQTQGRKYNITGYQIGVFVLSYVISQILAFIVSHTLNANKLLVFVMLPASMLILMIMSTCCDIMFHKYFCLKKINSSAV